MTSHPREATSRPPEHRRPGFAAVGRGAARASSPLAPRRPRPAAAPRVAALLAVAAASACGGCDDDAACNPSDPGACGGGTVCERISGGSSGCFAALVVNGHVTDLAGGAAVAGARVVAMDANRAPAAAVATTGADGAFSLAVPATRGADGAPVSASVTLRADAQGFQGFPAGLRPALPIDLSTAAYSSTAGRWIVEGPLTAVKLVALPSVADLVSISGVAAQPPSRVGVLVVAAPSATPTTGGRTAIAGPDGSYTVFNVPASSGGIAYGVNAYAQGVNYAPASVTATSGAAAPRADLSLANATAAAFSGGLIFNSGATTPTSVALVVQSTYDATLDRGESPPGLLAQVPAGGNGYAFTGVPDGAYVALAAFGIDGDVRDQSGAGNTAPVLLTVTGGALQGSAAQFKLVGAVALTSIGGVAVGTTGVPVEIASATPEFVWANAPSYSSADTFRAEVYDTFGTQLWTTSRSGLGSGPFTATYAGPALVPEMYYQLRITALAGADILSCTEDLKGVFVYRP